jgi:hypothetical protein
VDAALDFYSGLVELVRGKVTAATGAAELNAALSTVLVGMWAEIDDGRLRAEFRLRVPDDDAMAFRLSDVSDAQLTRQRRYLDADPDAVARERAELAGHTGTSTLVYVHPVWSQISW